jgi:pantoate--beta-alanine ligase
MQIFETFDALRDWIRTERTYGHEIGFVPTMGYLHPGHLSLVQRSLEENDRTVASIFVNPTQFGPGEDFETYPRDPDRDLELCREAGVDAVFLPETGELYAEGGNLTSVVVGRLTDRLCGLSRGQGHFRGVCTVVCKLFNIVQPDRAYFGQKDAQQAVVIDRMVRDLNMPVAVRVCPVVREEDGLALSSRNARLSADEREEALGLYEALCAGREIIRCGERAGMTVLERMHEVLAGREGLEIDYLEIVDPEDLEEVAFIDDMVLLAGAVRVGEVRLIDNLLVDPETGPWE